MIPYSRQSVSDEDITAVIDTLRSDYLTQGPVVKKFESAVASYCGAPYAVATVNATSALHVAMMLLSVSSTDLVWVPAISFVASANCARYCGADVDFVDVEADTGLLSLQSLAEKLEVAARSRSLPKVLVVVHIAGQSVDMERVLELCTPYGIRIVEDASHGLSGEFNGQRIGCCQYSDITIFSFHPVKPLTSGEGGMLTTKDAEFAARARRLIEHGIERDPIRHRRKDSPFWYYEQQELGFNYRLSDIHSALGLSQLSRIDELRAARELIAAQYTGHFQAGRIKSLRINAKCRSSWHLYIIQCENRESRDKLIRVLRSEGYALNVHYLPIPSQPYYRDLGARLSDFPQAERYSTCSVSLPIFPGLAMNEVNRVVNLCKHSV